MIGRLTSQLPPLRRWPTEKLWAGSRAGQNSALARLGRARCWPTRGKSSSKFRVNQALKKRDWFMPYAPAVLEERGAEFFECFKPAPFMNTAFAVRPDKAHLIPAAIHVDGSCRAQSVSAEGNPLFHRLISQFYKITDIPLVLNTSFNRHGVPIVSTPRQAIEHLLDGSVDLLAIEGFLIHPLVNAREAPMLADDVANRAWEHLKWAAGLLANGQVEAAAAYLARSAMPFRATREGIALSTEVIWAPGDPLAKLRAHAFEKPQHGNLAQSDNF